MIWLKNFTLGAAAFLAVHAIEVYRWKDWFDPTGTQKAWFLNTGNAIALTTAVVALSAAGGAMLWAGSGRDAGQHSLGVAVGAGAAMATTLFVIGPGNIFPIVLLVGTGIMTISAVVGSLLGFAATLALRAVLDRPKPP